jgi:hypothetical protein
MKTTWRKTKDFVDEHSNFIPLVVTLVPFLAALTMTLILTQGSVEAAGYIITKVGIVNIWLSGLIYAATVVVQVLVIGILYYVFLEIKERKDISNGTGIMLAGALFFAIMTFSMVIYLGLVTSMILNFMRRRGKKKVTAKQRQERLKGNLFVFAGLLTLLMFSGYPYTARTELIMNNGDRALVMVLSQSENEYIVAHEGERLIEVIDISSVKATSVCLSNQDWAGKSIPDLISGPIMRECS